MTEQYGPKWYFNTFFNGKIRLFKSVGLDCDNYFNSEDWCSYGFILDKFSSWLNILLLIIEIITSRSFNWKYTGQLIVNKYSVNSYYYLCIYFIKFSLYSLV